MHCKRQRVKTLMLFSIFLIVNFSKTYLAVDNWIFAWKQTSIKTPVSELYLFLMHIFALKCGMAYS